MIAPARALSRLTGSYWCHFASGKSARIDFICAARVGEVIVSVRKRRPAPFLAFKPSFSLSIADRISDELRPRPGLATIERRLRTVGIVKRQHRSLRKDVGRGCTLIV